ncbi:MAG: hypothetical protein ABI967_02065 [bacterium]
MRSAKNKLVLLSIVAMLFLPLPAKAADDADVRNTVQRVFQQLKSRDYGALYDSLPTAAQSRMTRERFSGALQRAQAMYVLDRMDVGQVRVSKNIAIVDTVLYGRVLRPIQTEGKIVVQQYLVREEGKWKVATGDSGTIKRFLSSNPVFRSKFPIRQPKVFVKQGNDWVEFSPPRR